MKKKYIIPLFIPHLGCPNNCIFCNQKKLSGKKDYHFNQILLELNRYLKIYKDIPYSMKEIAFYGGSFTAVDKEIQEKLLEKAFQLKEKKEISKIRLSTRPDALEDDKIQLLKKYKVDIVELGFQSLDDSVLIKAARGMSSEMCIQGYRKLKASGFQIGIQLLPGLPGSNRETILNSVKKTADLKPDFVRIYPLVILKDTPLEKMYNKGLFKPIEDDIFISILSEMIIYFESREISVIRMGIHNVFGNRLNEFVVGGMYFENLKDIVQTKIYRKIIKKSIEEEHKIIYVNEKEFHWLSGYKKRNRNWLKNEKKKIEIAVNKTLQDSYLQFENMKKINKYKYLEV